MILAVLGLLSTIFTLANTLIEKYGSEKHLPTIRKISRIPKEWTQEKIAKIGVKKGLVG